MNILEGFRNIMAHRRVSDKLLVPLLIWSSGIEKNIELCQRLNRKFFYGNRNIYIDELTLSNSITHMIKYPKAKKAENKADFFYNDVCVWYNWTRREFDKNINVLDLESLKPIIAKAFGYNNLERKRIGLELLKRK